MQLIEVKKANDIVLGGIAVEFEKHNTSLVAVTLRDSDGRLVKIAKGEYGEMVALVPAPPKKIKKFRLSGKFEGLVDVCEDFDSEAAAKDRLREFERVGSGEPGLKIEAVEVEQQAE